MSNKDQQATNTNDVSQDYFEERSLDSGGAGWLLLAGLGVAAVISGDFAGWNFGLAQGGWGGLLIATVVMAVMYLCMMFSLAELSAAIPSSGGAYAFARRAYGPLGGFMAGAAIMLATTVGSAAIVAFIGAYFDAVFGIGGWPVFLGFYVVFVGLHLLGVGEALKIMFVITLIAIVALLVFAGAMIPHFEVANLFDIEPSAGGSAFLPNGLTGVWAAVPFAIWFFIGVEGVALAAEETPDPKRNMPRAMISAITVLLILAGLMLVLGPGGSGASAMMLADNPLTAALESPAAYGGRSTLSVGISLVALSGLVASFFSVIFVYSRQIFALSRAGYIPRILSRTGSRKTPVLALTIPALIGFGLAVTQNPEYLVLMAVFGMSMSWLLTMSSHIILRVRDPEMPRPYRTPGGIFTSSVALVLAAAAFVAGFLVEPRVIIGFGSVFVLFLFYFAIYSRKHLVASAPDEGF